MSPVFKGFALVAEAGGGYPHAMSPQPIKLPELLAPAGDSAAAYAALQAGADAIYTGLTRFSARADAVNLPPAELEQVVAFAHAQTPRRRVYVTLNTLLQEHELADALQALDVVDASGVDAVIIQDLGLHRLARRAFPRLRLHASTQLAVHNADGVRALAELGFQRVVLTREVSIAEASAICHAAPIEIELFVHGALCYSYSGLCLFSSHQSGRSGNRGRCAYCCREPFAPADGRARPSFPFSMRDLALAPRLPELAASGAASLKIEGRMKSAFYVACVTDYYRRKLDGRLTPAAEDALVQDLQTIFSRPWTQLYADGRDAPSSTIIDAVAIGHRGAPIGEVQAVTRDPRGLRWLRFVTRRALEKHDGLQVDLPRGGKPCGFPVDALRCVGSGRLEVSLPAGAAIEVALPADEASALPAGATVYCSASQAVRRRYQIPRPRAAESRLAHPADVQVSLRLDGLTLTARAGAGTDAPLAATVTAPLTLTPARQPDQTEAAVRRALTRTGDTLWQVSHLTLDDPQGLFVPASALNAARRRLFAALTAEAASQRRAHCEALRQAFGLGAAGRQDAAPTAAESVHWNAKFNLDGAAGTALAGVDEIILNIGHQEPAAARRALEAWLALMPRNRLRLALPMITRPPEAAALHATLAALLADGWTRWECADMGGCQALRASAAGAALDLTADWTPYGLNHLAREQLAEWGITRTVASPEDAEANIVALAAAPGPAVEVLVWQQTPLFIAETAPVVPRGTGGDGPQLLVNRRGGRLITHRLDGRWITVAEEPFCLAAHQPGLRRAGIRWFRVDFSWSPPGAVRHPSCWDDLLAGRAPAASHTANFLRGLA